MQRRLLLLLLLHLAAKIVQRLDMPKAFAGDGTEGQRTEKVDEEDFRYVKELLSVNGSLLKVRPNILFFDFIASCFLACPLAGHLAAFEQMQRRGFADMAKSVKLILVHHIGHAVPVNR